LLEPPVGARRCLLNEDKGADEFRKMANRDTGDREILDRAKRMNAPISLYRNLCLAEKVVLPPGRDAVKVNRARHVKRECGSCVASRSLRG
jgi:phosphopantothenoylcysteine synthetase/decarboxylase